MSNIQLVDSHTHLDAKEFDGDREEVIVRAKAAGVTRIVTIGAGDGFESASRAIALATQHSNIWASAGIHPHDAAIDLDMEGLRRLASHPKVVAVGETGLDYYRDWCPVDKQRTWFEAQIHLALELNKPLIIHSREAGRDCLQLLRQHGADKVGGVFHCFAEDANFAASLREINFLVSFPGSVTFKKALAMKEAAKQIPLEQIMVETDAPYLAPEPFRGKRCESSFVLETARAIAELKGISIEALAEATTQNAIKFYKLI